VLRGSLSHLAAKGLAVYAKALVGSMLTLKNMVGKGVNVMPFVPIPLGGVGREYVVRSMMDLKAWITSSSKGQSYALVGTRVLFWRTVVEVTGEDRWVHSAPFTYVLPMGLYNTRDRSTNSPAFAHPIPARIPPFTQQQ